MGLTSTYATVLALVSAAVAQQCPLIFDGRIPAGSTPAFFDTDASPFGTDFVIGRNLTFSQIVKLPTLPPSLFDAAGGTIPVGITIDDRSIFAPSPTNVQLGFRRAEFQPDTNNGSDPSTIGIRTLHFSIRKDNELELDTLHEYQFAFLEDSSYSTNQFVLKYGTIYGQPVGQDPDSLVLVGNVNSNPVPTLFVTKFTPDVYHNFGIVLNFEANTTQVFYSTDDMPLANVTAPEPNNVSGRGQYHVGLLKKSTGDNITDVTREGFQPAGIHEGVIYAGLFMEDSANNCISLGGGSTAAGGGRTDECT